ncbi:MAG TPA: hypothetical protein VGC11_05735 [Acidimicrobiia bacterium]
MTDEDRAQPSVPPPQDAGTAPRAGRTARDPASTLTTAMLVYIFVTLVLALPIVILPAAFFDVIGLDDVVADEMGGLRWVGATLLAWAIAGILVMARPGGRAIFVTTGALQLTLAGLALMYSWSVGEYGWSTAYQVLVTIVVCAAAAFLWWARLSARKLL